MAIQSFYISVEIPEEEKELIIAETNLKRHKKTGDLIYKNTLFIDDVSIREHWWHINAGFYDFFHSCEALYEFCRAIEIKKPNFTFLLLGQEYNFSFDSLIDFISFVYPKIASYIKRFENCHGILSVPPNKFFSFKRKNHRFFRKINS